MNPIRQIVNYILALNSNEYLINYKGDSSKKINPKIKIAIMASGNGSNFEAIVKSRNNRRINVDVALLIVNKEKCPAINKAKFYGIDYIYIDHRKYNDRETYDKEILRILREHNVEAIIMAGWMRIVTSVLIKAYNNKIINIHPSLLPSFKGTNSIKRALNSGVKITGCTVHKVIEEIDSGEILAQAAVKINNNDNLESLTKKIQSLEHVILPKAISSAAIEWSKQNQGK